jgi:HAD superfamily hydrolase (TIGR01509 family)
MSEVLAYILDIDGTLLDSHPGHLRAWRTLAEEYGHRHPDDYIVAQFGQPTPAIARILLGTDDEAIIKAASARKAQLFIELIPTLELFGGVRGTLGTLHALGRPVVLASSNFNPVIEAMVAHFGLGPLIAGFIGLGDIHHGKPHPEMPLKAAALAGAAPTDCVMVGDTQYDVLAGRAAGMHTVAVCTGNVKGADWVQWAPDLVLEHFAELGSLLPLRF